jgi:hypothetical protein
MRENKRVQTSNPKKILQKFASMKGVWRKSGRPGDTGVGYTLESDFNIEENTSKKADIAGIELKTTREDATNNITLFSQNPLPRGTNTKIRKKYGYPDPEGEFPSAVVLSSPPIDTLHFTKCKQNEFGFKLYIDESNKRIGLLVKDYKRDVIISEDFFYSFEFLCKHVKDKLKHVLIDIETRQKIAGEEHFAHNKLISHDGLTCKKFIQLLKEGKIIFEFRIDVDRSKLLMTGKRAGQRNLRYGKPHDHGNGFRYVRCEALN